MANLLVDERDQAFTLFEMLKVQDLCETPKYGDYSKEMFEMSLETAAKLAVEELYPTLAEGDREGCKYENGNVYVPKSFHRLKKLFAEGGWAVMSASTEAGGQGFPYSIAIACTEYFIHNFNFLAYMFLASGAGHLIEKYGTEKQKKKYMEKMYSGQWGGTMALTEPEAGSDVGNLKTKAIRQPDGTFRLVGSKIFITGAESDLFENIINPVLARIEGDPAGTKGISIFLVPKYLVNDDGSLGKRNDYMVGGIEHKMGIRGSATCQMSFGDNGNCYAELLGEERQGMRVMFQMMNEARIGVGLQGLGGASAAYLHALNYAKERKQGASLMNMQNPDAPRVSIIDHLDVRRMLLWMKSHVDGMRALVYLCAFGVDREVALENREEAEKWAGIVEVLTPVVKSYCSDIGFRVTEQAIQIYGGYGYCQDYPVEQFMRDMKIASIYEGSNGIQALDLVGRKLGQKKGKNFINLLGEINATIAHCKNIPGLKDLSDDLQGAANKLAEIGMFFADCGKEGKFLIPVANAYPFLNMMGCVALGWVLLWQAGLASEKLAALHKEKGIDASKAADFAKDDKDGAYYTGKILTARYYIRNVLPETYALASAIKNADMSVSEIPEQCFAYQI